MCFARMRHQRSRIFDGLGGFVAFGGLDASRESVPFDGLDAFDGSDAFGAFGTFDAFDALDAVGAFGAVDAVDAFGTAGAFGPADGTRPPNFSIAATTPWS
jgi:hypothetical protein